MKMNKVWLHPTRTSFNNIVLSMNNKKQTRKMTQVRFHFVIHTKLKNKQNQTLVSR